MSYAVKGTNLELLAANIAPQRWHCAIGVPPGGMLDDRGYSNDELELEVLVALSWQVCRRNEIIVVSPSSSEIMDSRFSRERESATLLQPAHSRRYMSSSSGTVAIATSIPFITHVTRRGTTHTPMQIAGAL